MRASMTALEESFSCVVEDWTQSRDGWGEGGAVVPVGLCQTKATREPRGPYVCFRYADCTEGEEGFPIVNSFYVPFL